MRDLVGHTGLLVKYIIYVRVHHGANFLYSLTVMWLDVVQRLRDKVFRTYPLVCVFKGLCPYWLCRSILCVLSFYDLL